MDSFVNQVQAINMNATGKIIDFVNSSIKTLENKFAAGRYNMDADGEDKNIASLTSERKRHLRTSNPIKWTGSRESYLGPHCV